MNWTRYKMLIFTGAVTVLASGALLMCDRPSGAETLGLLDRHVPTARGQAIAEVYLHLGFDLDRDRVLQRRPRLGLAEVEAEPVEGIEPGFEVLGLAEGGVGWALDEHNEDLITPEMMAAVEAATQAIVSGEVVVHDYMSDQSCPY